MITTFVLGILIAALAYSRGHRDGHREGRRAGVVAEQSRAQAEQDARVARLMADIRRKPVDHADHSPVTLTLEGYTVRKAADRLAELFGGCAHTVEEAD